MKETDLTVEEQVKELEGFIFNNKELEKLESIEDKFNIFSSLGIINQEVRHSNFLAWLLNPHETHNLVDYFTTRFLKLAVYNDSNENPDLNLIDIDTLNLSKINVYREWNNIDVLLVDDDQKVVCVIENKVDSKEHSNQLTKYRKVIESNYSDYKKLYIYLTVYGEEPETEKAYISISYREVSQLIESLLERKESQMNDEVSMFIRHYNEMVKRYIMEESEVQELCEQLYKKHKKALDLIFKHKPDVYSDIRVALEEILDENENLEKDHCSKSYIRFLPKKLDFFSKEGEGWTKSKRILLFEIVNYDKAVDLVLLIGPGNSNIRESIYSHVKGNDIFNKTSAKLTLKWASIYKIKLSAVSRLEGKSKDDIKEKLATQLDKFFNHDYKLLEESLMELNPEKK
jgi:hypothetical protein|tara:strand:+ start:17 stop:1219 length:1203 start_codon:yes stop_codon:yes gene_type:complete